MPFDQQPTLTGFCVGVRPLQRTDFDALYAVACDPLIWKQHPAQNRHEMTVFHQFFDEAMASRGALLVTDLAQDCVIGSSRFHDYSEDRKEIEIGWTFLARSHWGGVYNGDLKSIMTRHAFRFVESIVFLIDPCNLRSQRAVVKLGAVVEPQQNQAGQMIFRLSRRSPA